jgi:flagellar basal-body rod protein FlgG
MAYSLYHTLNISCQDMLNRMMDLDTIANNLANVNTVGFRGSRMNFQELLSEQKLEGNTLINTQVSNNQGVITRTDNPLDWAIQGNGFFVVKLPNGEFGYTRDGMFQLDSKRQLVNSSGYLLKWDGQIPKEATSISIENSGEVIASLSDGTLKSIGKVQLASFANPTALINAGNNVWIPSEASGKAQMASPGTSGCGIILSGAYEMSNINLADEMTHLIQVQRDFQVTSKVFQQTDTMISEAIHIRKV